jgi:hypothetical protein
VTTQAPLRSRWTKAESAYHVRLTSYGDSLPSPSKDTRLTLPKVVKEWSPQSVQLKLIKTRARLVRQVKRLSLADG